MIVKYSKFFLVGKALCLSLVLENEGGVPGKPTLERPQWRSSRPTEGKKDVQLLALALWFQLQAHHFIFCFVSLGLALCEMHLPDSPASWRPAGPWQEEPLRKTEPYGEGLGRVSACQHPSCGRCHAEATVSLQFLASAFPRPPTEVQVSAILCVSCSLHPAWSPISRPSFKHRLS